MAAGFLYPTCYELYGLGKTGTDYFKDPWNFVDISYTAAGWTNIAFGMTFPAWDFLCVCSMCLVIFMALLKSFFFLRISKRLAYLVNLIKSVMIELKWFICFYGIILYNFALIFGTIGWHLSDDDKEDFVCVLSPDDPGEGITCIDGEPEATDGAFGGRLLKGKGGAGGGGDEDGPPGDHAGAEYRALNNFLYNLAVEFRMSMGDNDFGQIEGLGSARYRIVWFMWLIITYLGSVIMLNFIIA